MSWSPDGDHLAYFVRAEKSRTLIVQNILNEEDRGAHRHAHGRRSGVARHLSGRTPRRLRRAAGRHRRHLRRRSRDEGSHQRHQGRVRRLRRRPGRRTDKSIIYLARVSQNEKLFRLDLDTGRKTQITFGTHDDGAAKFLDADTLVFASTATDPTKPIDPEVARNGNIYNIWTLGLKTGELRQYTDAVGGNLYAVVVNDGGGPDQDRLRQLLQGQLRAAHARAPRADRQGGVGRLRRAAARSSRSRRRSATR